MTRTTVWRHAIGPIGAAVALLTLSACGGASDGSGVASAGEDVAAAAEDAEDADGAAPLDADAQALAFAECMRDQGVDMPDPEPGQRGLIEAFQHEDVQDTDSEIIEQARAACAEFLPQFEHGAEADHERERQEMALELAECMREQGFDVSDNLDELRGHDAIDDDELRAAMEGCRGELGGSQ